MRSYNTADPIQYNLLHSFAVENKKHQTEAESFLWQHIKSNRLGKKFNRQHVIDKYIVDFVCLESKLVIEVDGGYHSQEEQIELDEQRTERLQELGFTVIRFDNDKIISDIVNVIQIICRYL